MPTWRELWRSTAERLGDPVQARWLLEEASGADGAALLGGLDARGAAATAAARLESLVQRRLAGEPLQHVLGHWGFRTLEVAVDSRVLDPAPRDRVRRHPRPRRARPQLAARARPAPPWPSTSAPARA